MGKYFGTDGIRGAFGGDLINPEFAYRLGSAIGRYLQARGADLPLVAVIGRDTRLSGPQLVEALVQGLNRHGVEVHDLGVLPTPAIAQMLLEQQAHVGIAVTASHNPASDNGIKLFDGNGHKLTDAEEAQLERLVDEEPAAPVQRPLAKSARLDGGALYVNSQRALLDANCLRGWKIVLDLANGATCATTPAVFEHFGAELVLIGDQPSGENINRGVGSEYPQLLGQAVREHGANLGIAHDGDGDRLVVCDERGAVVDGDILLGLFAVYGLRRGTLRAATLVTTIQSNVGLDHAVRAAGGTVERVDVGDRNVARRMRELDANVGGESSGHIILSSWSTTGDGLLAAIQLIELLCHCGKPLSELRQSIQLFPQATANLRVADKKPLESLQTVKQVSAALEQDFDGAGRVLVRYSGTEPKIRLLVEARDQNQVEAALKRLEIAVSTDLTVV